MYVKIEYRSKEIFELDYKAEIYAQAEAMIQEHLWWNEPLTLYEQIEYPEHLTGDSKLLYEWIPDEMGPRRYVEPQDDALLAMRDYAEILKVLGALSEEHDFSWVLFYRGVGPDIKVIGRIESGVVDHDALQFLSDTLKCHEISDAMFQDEELAKLTYHKYFNAEDQPIFPDDEDSESF
jgi:hypothetical protein